MQQLVVELSGRARRGADGDGELLHPRTSREGRTPRALDACEHLEPPLGVKALEVRQQTSRVELGQPRQPPLDAVGEFTGGLAREGETEYLVPAHESICDEPHHPSRHRLGLAAPGSRDHERRSERGFDDGGLLRRRRVLTERRGEDDGGNGHDALTAPMVWMRHSP